LAITYINIKTLESLKQASGIYDRTNGFTGINDNRQLANPCNYND
jgi:hypothetical protein